MINDLYWSVGTQHPTWTFQVLSPRCCLQYHFLTLLCLLMNLKMSLNVSFFFLHSFITSRSWEAGYLCSAQLAVSSFFLYFCLSWVLFPIAKNIISCSAFLFSHVSAFLFFSVSHPTAYLKLKLLTGMWIQEWNKNYT